jgi:hypothetical protein
MIDSNNLHLPKMSFSKPLKRSKPVKSWEGIAHPSDRIWEKKLNEIKVQRVYFDYLCKVDGQTNGL